MTAKEKAVSMAANHAARFWEFAYELDIKPTPLQVRIKAKACALIAVDEIIKAEPIMPNNQKPFGEKIQSVRQNFIDANDYWNEVKQEIELL